MAKALIGYRSSDLLDPRLCAENDRLTPQLAEHLADQGLREEMADLQEMQPA